MIAAIYARKSTKDDREDADKSVTRQIELARAFAAEQKWSVAAEYIDDGVSGALRTKLIDRARMLADAEAEKFQVLIVRDTDRLSRDDTEPSPVLTLHGCGVQVWEYSTRSPVPAADHLHLLDAPDPRQERVQ
jgi:DNA invertase Pin-like site-specific DNA recombinase